MTAPSRFHTLIVGGGQAGLALGYHLARRRVSFLILNANASPGETWRSRWDSLRLFTPARYCGLAGMPFPARGDSFPAKDDMARYLDRYAAHFQLPIQNSARVEDLHKHHGRFIVTAAGQRFEAERVVVAMSDYQTPRIPEFAPALHPGIVQLHSSAYRSPSQLAEGSTLVVGAGNSGVEIALELARTRKVLLDGRESGVIPFRIDTALARFLLVRLVRFVGHRILTVNTPIGRRLRPKLLTRAAPLVRFKPRDLARAGVERVPRVVGASAGMPLLAGGRVVSPAAVVWCTGFESGFSSWLHLPAFGPDGAPEHRAGVSTSVSGLYFLGLHFLYAMTSATLVGLDRDAARLAAAVASPELIRP